MNINFNDTKINKINFYKKKNPFKIDDIDANKILVSKKEPYNTRRLFKYFIQYDDNFIRPLSIKLSQMIGYIK